MLADALTGAAVSLPVALLAQASGRLTRGGAAAGVVIAALAYAAFYVAGLAVLGVAFALTIASSRVRRASASGRVDAGDDDEVRGAANVVANCLVGAVAAALHLVFGWRTDAAALCFVTGIAAGASDTVASEIGRAAGGEPRALPGWHRVPAGTPGAVSRVGTLAGLLSAASMAAPAALLWLLPWNAVILSTLASALGSIAESVTATTLERRGLVGNHTLNLLNTAVAASTALFLFEAIGPR